MASRPGTYALLLSLKQPTTLTVGRLGTLSFPSGHYLYVGSALGGLSARVRRHLCQEKRPRWHIDYLLPHCDVMEVWYAISPERLECLWCRALAAMPGACAVRGFGSSDCPCPSHLIHFASRPSLSVFRERLGDTPQPLSASAKNGPIFEEISRS